MRIKEGFVLQQVAEANVVVPVGEATTTLNGVIMLNDSGVILWNILKNGTVPEALSQALTDEYGITAEKAAHDVEIYLESLRKIGCLEE